VVLSAQQARRKWTVLPISIAFRAAATSMKHGVCVSSYWNLPSQSAPEPAPASASLMQNSP
jgi:hypothetical protein